MAFPLDVGWTLDGRIREVSPRPISELLEHDLSGYRTKAKRALR
jgi:hypothetical protein